MNESNYRELTDFNKAKTVEYMPVICVVFITCLSGTVSNSFAIRYFNAKKNKSTDHFLLLTLSVINLLSCLYMFSIIGVLVHTATFTSDLECKTFSFLCHFFLSSSYFTIFDVSVFRFNKVYLRSTSTRTCAKLSLVFIFISALFVS